MKMDIFVDFMSTWIKLPRQIILNYSINQTNLELHKTQYNLAIENSVNRFIDHLNVGLDTKIVFIS